MERLNGTMIGYETEIDETAVSFDIEYSYDPPGPVERGEHWDYNIQVERVSHKGVPVPEWLTNVFYDSAFVHEAIVTEIELNS